jgi:membrane-bound lytic murein transglycosylase D
MKVENVFWLVVIGISLSFTVTAQPPQVPHKMQFAGMTLTIRDDARREIQKDVDALTLSPKHFTIKAERAKTYFPIIEKIFEEEHVPVDFKYLVLQESALIPDAVSPSNAVGFWQFKDFTAIEMGLRVDKQIDERMNIASASRGAAKYIKKNNFYFNNWVYALQAYQMGAGAVLKSVKDSEGGASHMEITSNTYWYVKKFLAHKVAFEDAVSGPGQLQVSTYITSTKKSLADIATENSLDEASLRIYNKWVKSDIIPDDRAYVVLIPKPGDGEIKLPVYMASTGVVKPATAGTPINKINASQAVKINGLVTIIALEGETSTQLAARAGIELSDFLLWNDISISDQVKKGQPYFVRKKRTRASEAYHKVMPGEDLWMISQQHGVQLRKLRKYNRLEGNTVTPGETLWLTAKRPKDARNIEPARELVEVEHEETFNWTANPQSESAIVEKKIEEPVAQVQKAVEIPVASPLFEDTLKIGKPEEVISKNNAELIQKDIVFSITVKKTQHIVQAGETLYSIAKQNEVGVMDLVNWNGLNLQEGIKPGQVLKLVDSQTVTADVKDPEVIQPKEIIHEVKSSETLYSVARKYGVTIKELMDWNGKKDFGVSVGDKLRIIRK